MKHCSHGVCTSNSVRNPERLWVPFVKPWIDFSRCKRWVFLCGRKGFKPSNVTKDTYICDLHFRDGEILDWKINFALEPLKVGINKFMKIDEKRDSRARKREMAQSSNEPRALSEGAKVYKRKSEAPKPAKILLMPYGASPTKKINLSIDLPDPNKGRLTFLEFTHTKYFMKFFLKLQFKITRVIKNFNFKK